MGTTMSFYHIQNQELDCDRLRNGLSGFSGTGGGSPQFEEMLKNIVGEEMFRQALEETRRNRQFFDGIFGKRPQLPSPVVAYRPDAPWLPFFDVDICVGYNASSRDALRLSEAFGVPVLAFAIFDSDILFVSYCDAAKNISYDYAKPNLEGIMDEYDTGVYQAEFPQFLLDLCPKISEEALREIWDGDEVFADDRMGKLCQVLGAVPFFCEEIPEGFETVSP